MNKDQNETQSTTETDATATPPVHSTKTKASKKKVMKAAKKNGHAKKAKSAKVAKSPQAQGAAPIELPFDKLNKDEVKIVKSVYAPKGERKAKSIRELQASIGGKDTSPTRNALRRLVRGGWLEKFERGTYRLTEKARKRGVKAA